MGTPPPISMIPTTISAPSYPSPALSSASSTNNVSVQAPFGISPRELYVRVVQSAAPQYMQAQNARAANTPPSQHPAAFNAHSDQVKSLAQTLHTAQPASVVRSVGVVAWNESTAANANTNTNTNANANMHPSAVTSQNAEPTPSFVPPPPPPPAMPLSPHVHSSSPMSPLLAEIVTYRVVPSAPPLQISFSIVILFFYILFNFGLFILLHPSLTIPTASKGKI
jgi:hypothetical protein